MPDELLMVPMDAVLIEQVLINLMENTVLHGETADKIYLSVTRTGSEAIFEVRDNGVWAFQPKHCRIFLMGGCEKILSLLPTANATWA